MKTCTGLFDHSMENLTTVKMDKGIIIKRCDVCGLIKELPHSNRQVFFLNTLVNQKKKWAANDNARELLQPIDKKGNVNDEFTEAYGFNPFDPRTKATTPEVQGGLAK